MFFFQELNAVYNIGDQDQSQLLNNIINETYNPAGQHNYIYDQQVQYMVHGTWYMVHSTCKYSIFTNVYVPTGTWYMHVHHLHLCFMYHVYMIHACAKSSLMYM